MSNSSQIDLSVIVNKKTNQLPLTTYNSHGSSLIFCATLLFLAEKIM